MGRVARARTMCELTAGRVHGDKSACEGQNEGSAAEPSPDRGGREGRHDQRGRGKGFECGGQSDGPMHDFTPEVGPNGG